MTVRAQEDQIVGAVVSPVSVDVLELERHLSRDWMSLGPATTSATFTLYPNKVSTQKRLAGI